MTTILTKSCHKLRKKLSKKAIMNNSFISISPVCFRYDYIVEELINTEKSYAKTLEDILNVSVTLQKKKQ